ncbi:MAG TPA: hypothetical protein VG755_46075 [Nannocystaceae bacterium]|nr:hypothetical protein [Nannocystaceae bacterium]
MSRAFSIVLFAAFVPGCACSGDGGGGGGADADGDGGGARSCDADETAPFRDQWKTIHKGRFDVLDDDGNPAISDLTIGLGLGYDKNFTNRGDVIVQFDGPPDTIEIELRRFTFACSEDDAADDFAKLQLWAYNASLGAPLKPDEMDDTHRCGGSDEDGLPDPWLDDCGVYVYYEGLQQLMRAGADIRVTLPPDYRQRVAISTGDDVAEDSYPNRGNVCVSGLDGTLDVDIGSGLAFVSLAPGASPMPACPEQLREECESFDDPATEGPDAWALGCGCIAQGYDFGHVKIASRAPSPSTMIVDAPAELWTHFSAENNGVNELAGKHCTATIAGFDQVEWMGNDPAQPWKRSGWLNQPSAAPPTGFGVTLASLGCDPVASVESPDDWDADEDDPAAELRGDLTLCTGCLAGTSCADLLPGG